MPFAHVQLPISVVELGNGPVCNVCFPTCVELPFPFPLCQVLTCSSLVLCDPSLVHCLCPLPTVEAARMKRSGRGCLGMWKKGWVVGLGWVLVSVKGTKTGWLFRVIRLVAKPWTYDFGCEHYPDFFALAKSTSLWG